MELETTPMLDRQGSRQFSAPSPLSPINSARGLGKKESETIVVEADSTLLKVEKLEDRIISEIVSCLKVKTSMLAHGACERIKKIAKLYSKEIVSTPILQELVNILKDGPGTPIAASAMSTLAVLALTPEGRQKIVIAGGLIPLIRLIERADVTKPNTDKALTLLMNLAADQGNRRIMRTEGAVEAVVGVLKQQPPEQVLEHCLGAIHNLALLDNKAKLMALEAGILVPLVRLISKKVLSDDAVVLVRAKMFLAELSKLPGVDVQIEEIAAKLRMPSRGGSLSSARSDVSDV